MEILFVVLAILIGIYCICAAVFNWNWFFNNHRAQGFVKLLGRNGARIAYIVIGVIIMAMGVVLLIGDFI